MDNTNSNRVICIGESLIDFICKDVDKTIESGTNYIKKAGGAPANVCAAIAKLGGNASFCGKVGNDPFGTFLKKTNESLNIDTSMMILDQSVSTTLAFVSLTNSGERDFVFNRGADALLEYKDLNLNKIIDSKIIHFGSATALLGNQLRDTYLKLMVELNEKGKFISFDPNYRADLWKHNKEEFINQTKTCLAYSDFVKVSEEELELITKADQLEQAISIMHSLGAGVVAVTLGKEGTLISDGKQMKRVESISVQSIDSTGAGDAFVGSFLYQLANLDDPMTVKKDFVQLKEFIEFSNKVGAIVCTKLGAIDGIPTLEEIEQHKNGVLS